MLCTSPAGRPVHCFPDPFWLLPAGWCRCRCSAVCADAAAASICPAPRPSVAAHGPHPAPRNNHHPPSVYHRNSRVSRDVSAFPSGLARAVPRPLVSMAAKAPDSSRSGTIHMHVIGGLRASCSPVLASVFCCTKRVSGWWRPGLLPVATSTITFMPPCGQSNATRFDSRRS